MSYILLNWDWFRKFEIWNKAFIDFIKAAKYEEGFTFHYNLRIYVAAPFRGRFRHAILEKKNWIYDRFQLNVEPGGTGVISGIPDGMV